MATCDNNIGFRSRTDHGTDTDQDVADWGAGDIFGTELPTGSNPGAGYQPSGLLAPDPTDENDAIDASSRPIDSQSQDAPNPSEQRDSPTRPGSQIRRRVSRRMRRGPDEGDLDVSFD